MSNQISGAYALKLEALECREVPAANVLLQGQTLTITSDAAADVVIVSEAGDQLFVNVNGQAQAPIARAAVRMISFDGGGGNDIFLNGTGILAIAVGGSGDDILVGGRGGNALLGGTGDDILVGGISDDVIAGESGNDKVFGGTGRDVLFGGTGRDQYLDDDRTHDAFDDRGNDPFDAPDDSDGRSGGGHGSDD